MAAPGAAEADVDGAQPGGAGAAALHRQLVALADPVRAEGERAYLKNCYEHLGVAMGPGRKVVKDWLRGVRPESDHVLAVAAVLWASEIYEDRRAAVELWVEVGQEGYVEEEARDLVPRGVGRDVAGGRRNAIFARPGLTLRAAANTIIIEHDFRGPPSPLLLGGGLGGSISSVFNSNEMSN